MTADQKQIIETLYGLLNSPTVDYIKKRFRRNRNEITVQKLTEIDEVELFECLGDKSAVQFLQFQEQLKINKL